MAGSRTSTKEADARTAQKKCPMCAEMIQVEAQVCHYCGARFAVTWHGYCANCHQVVDLDDGDKCRQCAGDVFDRQCTSELIPAAAASAPVPPPAAPPPAAPMAAPQMAAPQMAAPPMTAAPMVAAPMVAAPTVQGDLRTGYVGSIRQRIAEAVLGVAVFTCMLTTLLGLGGTDTFLFGMKSGISEARPGIWFFFVPLIALAVGVRHLGPRASRFDFTYRMRVKQRYGFTLLYKKSGVMVRVLISTALWMLGLILALAFISRIVDDGYTLQPGAYLLVVASALGMVATPLILPGRDNRDVRVDDAGELFQ